VTDGPTGGGWGKLLAAKVVCCGVLLLFLTGTLSLSGVLGWFGDGNPAWLALAGAGAVVGMMLWFRRRGRDSGAGKRQRQLETKGVR